MDQACIYPTTSNIVSQALRVRHTCAGGMRWAGLQVVQECLDAPMNCTMIKSFDVSDTHKDQNQCWAQCVDGFRGWDGLRGRTNYYCPRLDPENFNYIAENFKIQPHPFMDIGFLTGG
jgi:hypothetical protein